MWQLPDIVQANNKLSVILSNAKVCLIILATGMVGLSGCDPVRTIRQSVKVTVMDDHGLPASDVKVSMKESWESWGEGVAESERSYYRQEWASDFVPWYEGVTNAQGKAAIAIEETALDRTRGSEPPANRDIVSSREYVVKLQGQNVQNAMRVVMKPGAIGIGKQYTIRIEEIEKPRYVAEEGDGGSKQ